LSARGVAVALAALAGILRVLLLQVLTDFCPDDRSPAERARRLALPGVDQLTLTRSAETTAAVADVVDQIGASDKNIAEGTTVVSRPDDFPFFVLHGHDG